MNTIMLIILALASLVFGVVTLCAKSGRDRSEMASITTGFVAVMAGVYVLHALGGGV